ncbi:translation initiation factor IF-3 [Opitutia bacterium SCGC AG-212-L18]|nr:translation initiation factor IF-3 [Opitutae bacterium SCGC AG-212-L18]
MSNQGYSNNRGRSSGKSNQQVKLRRNERIRVPKIRLIDATGAQVGIVDTVKALEIAKQQGLDLVEVSPTAKPPVCRILNFGKYMYDEGKKNKSSKSTSVKLKEVKFRLNIDKHDYDTKIRRGEYFLNKGFKLKLTVMLRGREMEHKEFAFNIVNRAIEDLKQIGTPDIEAKLVGRNVGITMSPLPVAKRKLVYNAPDDEMDDEEDE